MSKKVLAIDFGASSGRGIVGEFDGESIKLTEIHRFSNDPVTVRCCMHWDVLRLFHEIKQCLQKAAKAGAVSVGVDTWGVDFALVDKEGRLLENPFHYRDGRTQGMVELAAKILPPQLLYSLTGNQIMEINTAFQLLSLVKHRPKLLRRAKNMLLMPDYFNFLLTGKRKAERTIVSTTQLYNQNGGDWEYGTANLMGIDISLLCDIIEPGTRLGGLEISLAEELMMDKMEVIAVCGHDTESALVAVPAKEEDFVFLSCGTWSLLGTELDRPLITEKSQQKNITNEAAFGGKTAFLKNIIGLWLIQESRRQWQREGIELSFAELEQAARECRPFKFFIDPDSPEFTPQGNIPERIREYCRRTGQKVPTTVGEIMRCIYDSLAMKYYYTIREISECTGKKYRRLYMIGGGTKDKLLAQLTANACGIPVCSGPVEATAYGNIAVQLMALGEIKDLVNAREIISRSEELQIFEPQDREAWSGAFGRYLEVLENA